MLALYLSWLLYGRQPVKAGETDPLWKMLDEQKQPVFRIRIVAESDDGATPPVERWVSPPIPGRAQTHRAWLLRLRRDTLQHCPVKYYPEYVDARGGEG